MSELDLIIGFVAQNLLDAETAPRKLRADDNLLKRGPIDSLGIVRLVDFLEQTFEVQISAGEVTINNFGTIDAMLALIERKRGGASSAHTQQGDRTTTHGKPWN